jgi:uncharacterized protein GlcG (DUF336 family)
MQKCQNSEHPSSDGGNRFSDKGMRKSNEYRARDRRRAVMTSRNNPVGLALACAMPMVLFSPANAQQDGLVTERNISLNMAKAIAETAVDTCRKMGYQISVTVVDRAGLVRASLRDDGAGLHTLENSQRKAYTARTFKVTTAEFRRLITENPDRSAQTNLSGVIAIPGGLPIKVGDDVVGAVGVSGTPGKDDVCSQAGIDKVAGQLK